MNPNSPRQLYALLIGIDFYSPNPLCESLYGAVADANAMEAFFLTRGVPATNIVKLTASHADGASPLEPESALPTYRSMIEAIRALGRCAAGADGELLIHYSGHGCRTPTLIPDTKGIDGLDEGIVPYDIAHHGARILRDIEISFLLGELRRQGVPTVVIFDACHSGSLLRSHGGLRTRGARGVDQTARPGNSELAPVSKLEWHWRREHRRVYSRVVSRGALSLGSHVGPTASLIAACRDREASYEYPFDGEIRGALTHSLLATLEEGDTILGWERLQRRVGHRIRRLGLHQTPIFEGVPSDRLLGLLRGGSRSCIRVIDLDPEQQRIMLDAGLAAGLVPGARLEIIPRRDLVPARSTISADVVETEAATTWARLDGRDISAVNVGDRAFLTDPGVGRRRWVQIVQAPKDLEANHRSMLGAPLPIPVFRDGRPLIEQLDSPQNALGAVASALDAQSSRLLERMVVTTGASSLLPDFRVALDRDCRFKVLQVNGHPVAHLPKVPAAAPGAPALVVERLIHLARYLTVLELENSDHGSPLQSGVGIRLGRSYAHSRRGDDNDPAPGTAPLNHFASEDEISLTITNHSPLAFHTYLLDLRPDWSIRLIEPSLGSEALPSGREVRLRLRIDLPAGIRTGSVTLKVIATPRPTNVRWLELPAIDQPSMADRAFLAAPDGPLEEFLATLLDRNEHHRSVSARRVSQLWITDQVEIEVVRHRVANVGGGTRMAGSGTSGTSGTSGNAEDVTIEQPKAV